MNGNIITYENNIKYLGLNLRRKAAMEGAYEKIKRTLYLRLEYKKLYSHWGAIPTCITYILDQYVTKF